MYPNLSSVITCMKHVCSFSQLELTLIPFYDF